MDLPPGSVPSASLHSSWRLLHEVEAWSSSSDPASLQAFAQDCRYVPHTACHAMADGLPPYSVPNFQFVCYRDIPQLGTWVWLSGVLEPRELGCPPVLCFVYWNRGQGRWTRFAAVANEDGYYSWVRACSSARHGASFANKGTQTEEAASPLGSTAALPPLPPSGSRSANPGRQLAPPSGSAASCQPAAPASARSEIGPVGPEATGTSPTCGFPALFASLPAGGELAWSSSSTGSPVDPPSCPDWVWGIDPNDPCHDHYAWIQRTPPGPAVLIPPAPAPFGLGHPGSP
jgi:hypothetical protein